MVGYYPNYKEVIKICGVYEFEELEAIFLGFVKLKSMLENKWFEFEMLKKDIMWCL